MDRGASATTTWMRTAAALLLSTAGCTKPSTSNVAADAAPTTSPATSASAPAPAPAPSAATASPPCKVVGKLSSARFLTKLVELPDGRVLFVGGALEGHADARAEVDAYDPKTSTVTPFASLRSPRTHPGVAALADGRVVVIGGYAGEDGSLDTIEVYEPSTKAFRVLPVRLERPTAEPFAIPMKDGRVLTGGGEVPPRGDAGHPEWPRSSFVLDPTTWKLTRTGDTPWPLGARGFYTVAESGVITVTGQGEEAPVTKVLLRDCATTFDPASKTWTDTKRCTKPSDPDRQKGLFHAANGAAGNARSLPLDGLELYRNGTWEKLNTKVGSSKTGESLFEGLSLDEHHVIAADGETYEVVSCAF